jgi:hypothetical protein
VVLPDIRNAGIPRPCLPVRPILIHYAHVQQFI